MARRPTDPMGAHVRNLLDLQGLGNGLSAEVAEAIADLIDLAVMLVAKEDPIATAVSESTRRARLQKVLAKLDELTAQRYADLLVVVRNRVAAIGAQQARWATAQLERTIGSVAVEVGAPKFSVNFAKSILDTDPIRGELLADAFEEAGSATLGKLRRTIQLGMSEGKTLDEVVRDIRGRSVNGEYVGGVMQTSTRGAETIARTAINDIANQAHFATWQENADIVEEYQFVATLDARTCPVCAEHDGKTFRLDDERAPVPPLHLGDRCTTVPVIAWKRLGIEPPKEGMRAAEGGPVSSSTTYEDWLRDQSAEKQAEVLGATRAEMFRGGEITLADLITSDGRIVRLDELN